MRMTRAVVRRWLSGLALAGVAALTVTRARGDGTPAPPSVPPASSPPASAPAAARSAKLPPAATFAPGITIRRDVVYGTGSGRDLHLDVYAPEKLKAPAPCVLWVHGGGWVGGARTPCGTVPLVPKGYVTASVEYRFSQEASFPAQIEDCKAAVRWVRAHAAELDVDPNRIGAAGASAGGHLVALLGVAGDASSLEGNGGNPGVSSAVHAVCDIFGPTDFLKFDGHGSVIVAADDTSLIAQLIGGSLATHKDLAIAASPVTYVTQDDPPFLILHGDNDPIVPLDQSVRFDAALLKAGVDSTLFISKGAGHGALGAAADGKMLEFFEKKLKVRKAPAKGATPAPAVEAPVTPAPPAKGEGR